MAKAKGVGIPVSIRRQLASLNHRVSWLEAALRPKADKPPIDLERAGRERQWAENPNLVKIARELERKENEFLRSRGLQPKPSDIPKEFQKRVRVSQKVSSAR